MIELSRFFILIGSILLIFDVINIIIGFMIRKDALAKSDGTRITWTLVLIFAAIGMAVLYIYIYSIHFLSMWFGVALFLSAVLFTLSLYMFLQHKRGMQARSIEILESVISAIELADKNLEGHSIFVHNLTMLLYDSLPLQYRIQINPHNLEYAALLLDIGKMGIPKDVLNKSGKLDSEEMNLVRRHPEIATMMLDSIDSFDSISTWIMYHHEWVDGSGYYHLKGEEIPLASRIIAVADAYSAITMERSYKARKSHRDAITELKMVSGTQLDSYLVECFCGISCRRIEMCLTEARKKTLRIQ